MNSITTERRGHLLLIGWNRTAKRNAVDAPMFRALARAYGELDEDAELRCGVVFAHGDHFTGGIDLAQYAPLFAQRSDPFEPGPGERDPFGLRTRMSKPVVMAVHGVTFTIGIELMLAADVRIAGADARFAQVAV